MQHQHMFTPACGPTQCGGLHYLLYLDEIVRCRIIGVHVKLRIGCAHLTLWLLSETSLYAPAVPAANMVAPVSDNTTSKHVTDGCASARRGGIHRPVRAMKQANANLRLVTHLPPRTRYTVCIVSVESTHYIDAAFCPPSIHLLMSPDSTSIRPIITTCSNCHSQVRANVNAQSLLNRSERRSLLPRSRGSTTLVDLNHRRRFGIICRSSG
jgi:hypothetical protein